MKQIPFPLWLKENLKKKRFKKVDTLLNKKKYGIIKYGKLKIIPIK